MSRSGDASIPQPMKMAKAKEDLARKEKKEESKPMNFDRRWSEQLRDENSSGSQEVSSGNSCEPARSHAMTGFVDLVELSYLSSPCALLSSRRCAATACAATTASSSARRRAQLS